MNNKTILFVLILLVLPLVSAIQTFPQSSEIDLKHPVRVNGGIQSGVNCNISVFYPNKTTLIDFEAMTDNNDYFNFSLNNTQTQIKGIYSYDVTCTDGALNDTLSSNFLINLGGVEPSEQRTDTFSRTIYIFFGLSIVMLIAFIMVRPLPIKITMFLLMMWFALMGVNASYISIQDEVLNPSIEGFFSFFLTISFYANYFIFYSIVVLWLITFIITLIERRKVKSLIDYG